jgi:hypothetical protein
MVGLSAYQEHPLTDQTRRYGLFSIAEGLRGNKHDNGIGFSDESRYYVSVRFWASTYGEGARSMPLIPK